MPPEQVILFIIGTIVILFGAYYVTYFIGMKASGQTRAGMKNRNISLKDRYAIARDKQFCVIEIAGKVYIVGVTNHAMTLLDTLDAEEFSRLTATDEEAMPWHMTPVGRYGNRLTRKLVTFVAEKTGKVKKETTSSGEADFAKSLKDAERNADDKGIRDENIDGKNANDESSETEASDSPPGKPEDD